MKFREDLDALLLGVLASGPGHGYDLAGRLKELGFSKALVAEGRLYPALHSLEERAFIAAEWVPQEGRPARKVYGLTDLGTAELTKRRESWAGFAERIDRALSGAGPREARRA
jgi:PadR family transcriptional regulator PadR